MKIRLPKNNMLRFLLAVFLFVLFSQNAFAGGIGKISPQKMSMGDTITIHGSGFGPMNYLSQVCWEGLCIDSENIQSWQDTKIVFLFNTGGMPTSGRLSVVTPNEEIRSDKVVVANPYIETINGTTNVVYSPIVSGQETTITGYYFGDKKGIIAVGDYEVTDIKIWSDQLITFVAPSFATNQHSLTIINTDVGRIDLAGINATVEYGNNPLSTYQAYFLTLGMDEAFNTADLNEVIVAVIDDGVQLNHEDLSNNILRKDGKIFGYNFIYDTDDPNYLTPNGPHGTAVAGIIAAENNNTGIVGIAPYAKIMPLIAIDTFGSGDPSDIIEAVFFAVDNGARVINLSLSELTDYSSIEEDFDRAVEYARLHDVIIVAAASNGDPYFSKGTNLDLDPISPICNDADVNGVVGVAGVSYSLEKTAFSDYGNSCIDFSAVAEDIFTIDLDSSTGYGYLDGNSFATPQVTGAIARLLSIRPELKPWEVLGLLELYGLNIDERNPNYVGMLGKLLSLRFSAYFFDNPSPMPGKYDLVLDQYKIEDKKLILYGNNFNKQMSVKIQYTSTDGQERIHEISTGKADASWHISLNLPDDFSKITSIRIHRKDGNSIFKKSDELEIRSEVDIPAQLKTLPKEEKSTVINYPDVSPLNRSINAIELVKVLGIMDGYPDGTFGPEKGILRAELMKVVIEAISETKENLPEIDYEPNCFPDINDEWFAKYVCFAKKQNWIEGYPDGTFGPGNYVNKAEAIKIILEIFGHGQYINKYPQVNTEFQDVNGDDWFAPYIVYANKLNILQDKVFFQPEKSMTRVETAEIIFRLLTVELLDLDKYDQHSGTLLHAMFLY